MKVQMETGTKTHEVPLPRNDGRPMALIISTEDDASAVTITETADGILIVVTDGRCRVSSSQ